MEILAVVPARSGSKGIPNKNIRNFLGKPLISYTINTALSSRLISRVVVSTDDEETTKISKIYKAEVPTLRPPHLADDKALVSDAVCHIVDFLKQKERYNPDIIVLLQPTSPLREVEDIDQALEFFLNKLNDIDALVSVCKTEQLLYIKNDHHVLELVSSEKFIRSTNRQELPSTYKLDGSMIYAIKTEVFMKQKTFLPPKTIGYIIPRWRAIDLDEPEDFIIGELIYQNSNIIKQKLKNFK